MEKTEEYVQLGQLNSPLRNLKSLKIEISSVNAISREEIVTILSKSPSLTYFDVKEHHSSIRVPSAFRIDDTFFHEWTMRGRECHRPWDAPLTWKLMCSRENRPEVCEEQARTASSFGLRWRFSNYEPFRPSSSASWSCPYAGPINPSSDETICSV